MDMTIDDQRQQMLGILKEILEPHGFKESGDNVMLLERMINEPGAQMTINGKTMRTKGHHHKLEVRIWTDGPCEELSDNRGFDLLYVEVHEGDNVQKSPGCSIYYDNAEEDINELLNELFR